MNPLPTVLEFLDRLEGAKLHYDLGHFRDSLAVLVCVPGAYWEVEFFEDGHVEVEIFRSKGVEADSASLIEQLFKDNSS